MPSQPSQQASPQSPFSFNAQPLPQTHPNPQQQLSLINTTPHTQAQHQTPITNHSLNRLYCQPCYKRGLINEPMYVNLNEFESNRYICEGCSVGQSYIIELEREFVREVVEGANKELRIGGKRNDQIENSKQRFDKEGGKKDIETEGKNQKRSSNTHNTNPQSTIQQPTSQTSSTSSQPFTPEFTRNISINHNDFTKYSPEDLSLYTQNIIKQYHDTLKAIEKYEEMVVEHVRRWRKEIKVQFEGVIGTFGGEMVGRFFEELRKLQILESRVRDIEQSMKEEGSLTEQQEKQYEQNGEIASISMTQQQSNHKNNIPPSQSRLQTCATTNLQQLYTSTKQLLSAQTQTILSFVQTLKMSGTRNLSHLPFLYRSCKGFSDAVQILVNLEQQQTRRRFEFISRKVKVCSIEATYDADMVSNGLLDNRIQRPPGFEEGGRGESRVNLDKQSHRSRKTVRKTNNISRDEAKQLLPQQSSIKTTQPQTPLPTIKQQQQQSHPQQLFPSSQPPTPKSQPNAKQTLCQQQLKNQPATQQQYKLQISNAVLAQQSQAFEKVKLAKINSQKPFSNAILNANKMARDEANLKERQRRKQKERADGVEIDLQSIQAADDSNKNTHLNNNTITPFPSMRQYYTYQKHRNLHQPKLQLTQHNFQRFPPPQVYLPSVQSLTLKYTPQHVEAQKFLAQVSTSFRKLIQLIIEDPKFATKNAIIMIAELFPKLKSLVIRCQNEFDWELGKYFEKKMKNLVRFEVSPEKKGD